MRPTIGNGKICYVEMPATDRERSAAFYHAVFGWTIRTRGDGSTAFDDGVGEVSGAWVTGRPPQGEPGLLVYIMVDSVAATIEAVIANGGELVQARTRGGAGRRRCNAPPPGAAGLRSRSAQAAGVSSSAGGV